MSEENDDKKRYLQVILILMDSYLNWKFEAVNKDGFTRQFNVWYNLLNHIPIDVLEYVIYDYIKENEFPPQSPANILNHYKKLYKEVLLTNEGLDANSKFDKAREIYKDRRLGSFDVHKTCKILEEQGDIITARAYDSIQHHLGRSANTEDIEKWGRIDFIKKFDELMELEISKQVKENKSLLLVSENKLLLGEENK